MTRQSLTSRQKQVLDYVAAYFDDHGQVPSLREIGNAVGISSTNGVMDHLRRLSQKGHVDIGNVGTLKSRAYRVIRLSCGTEVAAKLVPLTLLSSMKSCAS